MTTKTNIRDLSNALGLTLYTYAPGDGATRYRFFLDAGVSDYFDGDQLFTAYGAKAAETWLRGYQAGKYAQPTRQSRHDSATLQAAAEILAAERGEP